MNNQMNNNNNLYIILKYALNKNIYEIISSIKKFCFSYLSLSSTNTFQLFLIYNNSYTILFPNKLKDSTYFLTSNYSGVSESIDETMKNFFAKVSDTEDKIKLDDIKVTNSIYAINIILKKILLEINSKNKLNKEKIFKDRIILINDSRDDFDEINQKYLFLLKKEKIGLDILTLNDSNKGNISKSLCFFTNGYYDKVTGDKNNIEQILIQEYLPTQNKSRDDSNIKNECINFCKIMSDNEFLCSSCHNSFANFEDLNNINMSSSSEIQKSDNKVNNQLFYMIEKKILCSACYKRKYKQTISNY